MKKVSLLAWISYLALFLVSTPIAFGAWTITAPFDSEDFWKNANISAEGAGVLGQSRRLRLYSGSTIMDDYAPIQPGGQNLPWYHTLSPPAGGWLVGTATLKLGALDSQGEFIADDDVDIDIVN